MHGRRSSARDSLALLLFSICLFAACGDDGVAEPGRCSTSAECNAGETCVRDVCEPVGDAGAATCSATHSMCGAGCCAADQTCGANEQCCVPEDLCAGVCCGGSERTCVAGQCVVSCDDRASCGSGSDVRCCDDGQVCLLDGCTDPGAPCDEARDCSEDSYCEPSIGRCLPRATDLAECEHVPAPEEFQLQEQWRWSPAFDESEPDALDNWNQVMSSPVVANLTDDNDDGSVDENDVPDVVFAAFRKQGRIPGTVYNHDGLLRALSGDDGRVLWPTEEPGYRVAPNRSPAIADVWPESPGPEIIGCAYPPGEATGEAQVAIFSSTGELLFRYGEEHSAPCFGNIAVADMDGDGVAEVAVDQIIARADGSGVVELSMLSGNPSPALYDADGDGDLEYIGVQGVAHHDGAILWHDSSVTSGYVALADLDGDSDPDIVATNPAEHTVTVRDAATGDILLGPAEINPLDVESVSSRVAEVQALYDQRCAEGTELYCERDPLTGGGPPTVANFDEDPEPEFALAGGYAYVVFEHLAPGHVGGEGDVTPNADVRKWYVENDDESSRATGSSVFDFEGDGIAEAVYADERTLRAMRGETGEVYLDTCNSSGTLLEYPLVVDVDNDDHAEIVVAANNYARSHCDESGKLGTGIRVFKHPDNEWVRTRRIWNQHTYHVSNVHEDGTLPVREAPNWTTPGLNNFRQNVQPEGLLDAPDLVIEDIGFSTRACADALLVWARVVNRGRAGVRAGIPVSFFVDGSFAGRAVTTEPLLPGASEVVEIRFAPVEEGTAYELSAHINAPAHDPVSDVEECRTENNGSETVTAACPGVY